MANIPLSTRLRKKNLQKSDNSLSEAILEASLALHRDFPAGFIYPANPKTKVPIIKGYNSRRMAPDALREWLSDYPAKVPAIIPQSFGLVGIDVDVGEPGDLELALLAEGIAFLSVRSGSQGWHVFVRCNLSAARMRARWAAYGASGDMRYRQNILLYRDTVVRLQDFLADAGRPISGAFRDSLYPETPKADVAGPYDTVAMAHGREVYMAELKHQDTPAWAGALAQLQGMKGADIKKNQLRAIDDAVGRLEWAQDQVAGLGYRGRIRDTLAAMVALAADDFCWASHSTIAEVAGYGRGNRNTVRRHLPRLEADGVIERTHEAGKSWRGSPTVVWRIVRHCQTVPQ